MNYPKITIVTPSFNQGNYLEETICSVLDQGYPNLEYIVIDGGSTDQSVEIIKKYADRLSYWVSEKDKGMYDAIQKGFARSTGDVMAWINSDDKYYPRALSLIGEVFATLPQVNWLQGNPSNIDESSRIVSSFSSRRWSKYNFYMKDYKYIQQESTFWRRSLWEKAGSTLNVSLKYAGDFELWLRFFDYEQLYCLRTVVGQFRLRTSNQFSLERLDDYNRECESEIDAKLNKLDREIIENIAYLKKYWSIYSRIPYFKSKSKQKFDRIMNAPAGIVFDRKSQRFIVQ